MRIVTLNIDPERLPPIDLPVDSSNNPRVIAAIDALARGEWRPAAALPADAQAPALELLTAILGAVAANDIVHREAQVDRLASQLGATPLVLLLKALCRDGSGDAESARRLLATAFAVSVSGDAATEGSEWSRIAIGLQGIIRSRGEHLADRTLLAIARGLNRLEAMSLHGSHIAAHFDPLIHALAANPRLLPTNLLSMAEFLGMSQSRDCAWQDKVFADFVCPLLRALIVANRMTVALAMELPIYESYIKRRESAAHFKHAYDKLTPIYADAGRRVRQTLPPMPAAKRREKYRVAFLVPNLVDLAHVQVSIDVIECLQAGVQRRLDCTLASFVCNDSDLRRRCTDRGIPVVVASELKGAGSNTLQALLDLRTHLIENQFDAVVWVTSAPMAAFCLAVGLAPTQIFLSLKYHSFALDEITDYLTTGAAGEHRKILDGRSWRTAQAIVSDLMSPAHAEAAEKIRGTFPPGTLLLSCIGREEKIDSEPFLETVVQVLKSHPNAVFLWSGREERPGIVQRFVNHGVAAQTRFVGWVESRLYAQVTDIFLDSFPFPCGHTVLQAMAAGKPAVFFDTPESRASGIPMYIEPILSGTVHNPPARDRMVAIFGAPSSDSRFLLARDPSEYSRFVDRLILDARFRESVGSAAKAFVAEFMINRDACADSFQSHVVEVIDERSSVAK